MLISLLFSLLNFILIPNGMLYIILSYIYHINIDDNCLFHPYNQQTNHITVVAKLHHHYTTRCLHVSVGQMNPIYYILCIKWGCLEQSRTSLQFLIIDIFSFIRTESCLLSIIVHRYSTSEYNRKTIECFYEMILTLY